MNNLISQNPPAFDLPSFNPAGFSDLQRSQTIGGKYLAFLLGADFYAVSLKMVVEATPFLPVTVLPYAPEWLTGIVNLRGEIISIVDFSSLFGKKISTFAPKQKLIILRSEIFDSGVAFAADKLNEIVTLPNDKIQLNKGEDSPYIFGKAVHESATLNLIDTEKLFASLVV